jgi:hypothetical protein
MWCGIPNASWVCSGFRLPYTWRIGEGVNGCSQEQGHEEELGVVGVDADLGVFLQPIFAGEENGEHCFLEPFQRRNAFGEAPVDGDRGQGTAGKFDLFCGIKELGRGGLVEGVEDDSGG